MMLRKALAYLGIALLAIVMIIAACKKDEESKEPASPSIPEALHVYSDYFYVSFTGVPGADGYRIYVATDNAFNNILPDYDGKEAGVKGLVEISGVDPVSEYYCRMKSYNSEGESGFSNTIMVKTGGMDTIQNLDFERWITYPNYEEPAPVGIWATTNKVTDLNPNLYTPTTFKITDAQSGNYAARMITDSLPFLPLITGSVTTGVFQVNLDAPLKSLVNGVPYKTRPTRFKGYYKYFPVDGDSCEIRATIFRWNAQLAKRDTIGEAVLRTTDTVSEWTFFDREFKYWMTDEQDSMEVIFASSSKGSDFIGGIGSELHIDNVSFEFSK